MAKVSAHSLLPERAGPFTKITCLAGATSGFIEVKLEIDFIGVIGCSSAGVRVISHANLS
jgi:hypothetical protein